MSAISSAGYRPGDDVAICVDPAASEFFKDGRYELAGEGRSLSSEEMVELLGRRSRTATRCVFARGRDGRGGLGRDGAADRAARQAGCSSSATTSSSPIPAILREGIERGVANAILIKLNQIGTLTETLDTIALARDAGYRAVISHRSGETEDTFIADLAVATGVGQIKTGAPARSERVAKYNQLLRIEEELGERARYAGRETTTSVTDGGRRRMRVGSPPQRRQGVTADASREEEAGPARKTSATTAARPTTASTRKEVEQAAERFEKALADAGDALQALAKDAGHGAQRTYKELAKTLKALRREAEKTNRAMRKDLGKLAAAVTPAKPVAKAAPKRPTSSRTPAKKSP